MNNNRAIIQRTGPLLDRRSVLAGALITTAALTKAASAATNQVDLGLQMFTLADEMRHGIAHAIRTAARLGFQTVELIGNAASGPETARALRQQGLVAPSVHFPPFPIEPGQLNLSTEIPAVIDFCQQTGARAVVVPGPPLPARLLSSAMRGGLGRIETAMFSMNVEEWDEVAGWLNCTGEQLSAHGISLVYHNHRAEFASGGNGSHYDRLIRNTDPNHVRFELDCGWAALGGGDPAAILREYAARIRYVHVKDYRFDSDGELKFVPAGMGIMDWAAIWKETLAAKIETAFVEIESPSSIPALRAASESRKYLLGGNH